MNQTDIATIEKLIGKSVASDLKGSITDLNQAPPELIEDARKLPFPLALRYLRYYVDPMSARYLPRFIEDVVEHGQDPSQWFLGRILVPSFFPEETLQNPISSILARLEPTPDEVWRRFPPNRESWEINQFKGAPAVVRPQANYRWRPPEHVMGFSLSHLEDLEPVGDVVIAARRWIASAVAGTAYQRGMLDSTWEPHELVKDLFPEIERLSEDADLAIRAVLAEERLLEPDSSEIPGFRGPDEWYAGNVPEE